MRASFEPTTSRSPRDCPGCGSNQTVPFFELPEVPSNSCILLASAEEARNCPRGRVLLCFCEDCGFIGNHTFEQALTEYSERYEETQGFSPTFNAYLNVLAASLIARLGLRGKQIVEIGCGKGEFLALLCEQAQAQGVGFDPAFREDRKPASTDARVRYVQEFYSEAYSGLDADLYCSRMTLEHIPEVGDFMSMLRRTIGERPDAQVYCQIPEFSQILRKGLYTDAPYEHCSYFSEESLAFAFRRAGFDVVGSEVGYGGQHLGLFARPGTQNHDRADLEELRRLALEFAGRCAANARESLEQLERADSRGESVVLWGSGSKSTAFLTSLGIVDSIEYVVDINPYRRGMFMAGTGQKIIAPEDLREAQPRHVIIMNPIYREEIRKTLSDLGLSPELHDLASA
ncbi:MAG: SAM-dependent methyltransferase [Chlamydiales bacterium]|jgi:SAM-dependent methyltransferase